MDLTIFATPNMWMQVSSDLSIVDLDIPFNLVFTFGATTNFYSNLMVLAVVTWQVLAISIPMVYLAIRLQVRVGYFILQH